MRHFTSFKFKLGFIVGVSVLVAAALGWAGSAAGLNPYISIPLTILAALLVTQLLARGMTSPLREMTLAAKQMQAGNYANTVQTTSRDEVGQLAKAFNSMAAQLQQTDQLRSDLVANVSHELRTPLAALRAQLENMADGVTELNEDSINIALSQTERLSRLVNYFLDLSRIEAGVSELEKEWISLMPFLHEVLDSAQFTASLQDTKVNFLVQVEPVNLSVYADPARLHQVITNLLDNASKHSPEGGHIFMSSGLKGEDFIFIEVRDEGPGIAVSERESVFERFDRGSTDAAGGTGLGLAIARWAVNLHGGTIEVIDHPGRSAKAPSSTIRVLLPIK